MIRQRPGALTASGIMCIIYGAMHGLGALSGLVMQSLGGGMGLGQGGAEVKKLFEQEIPHFNLISWVNVAFEILEVTAMIAAGIGLLNMKSWSRTVVLPTLIWIIIRTLAYAAFTIIFVAPLMSRFFDQELARQGVQKGQGPDIGGLISGITGFCTGTMAVFWVIYLATIMYLVFKPDAARALAEGGIPVEPRDRDDEPRPRADSESRPRDDYDDGWEDRRPPAGDPKDDRYR